VLVEKSITNLTQQEAVPLCGLHDRNLRLIRDSFEVSLTPRNGTILIQGDKTCVAEAVSLIERFLAMIRSGLEVSPDFIARELKERKSSGGGGSGSVVRWARTRGQERYLEAMENNEVVCCVGPAGTGKTYLAVKMAVHCLKKENVKRLVLCRPAVEAGEKLGFLPGDLYAKVHPYLRPLYDALNDVLDYDKVKRYLEREIMEVIPLAYMRGRTLNNAFIILDEGQNTTHSQMKMFLTRMGEGSRIVVTGDITQIDLPSPRQSGLVEAGRILRNIPGLAWTELDSSDIVRHKIVARIVRAYKQAAEDQDGEDPQ
jgi:phosphate starvation-inducible PhoH-like protein